MNLQALMQQAQMMQKQIETRTEDARKSLAQKEVQGDAGNGMVKVTMTGKRVVKKISIEPSLLQDDAEIVEDLLAAAVNDAVAKADALYEETMANATAGMGLPPNLQGLF